MRQRKIIRSDGTFDLPKFRVGSSAITKYDGVERTVQSLYFDTGKHWYFMTDGSGPFAETELR
jgi:hypothetical protein